MPMNQLTKDERFVDLLDQTRYVTLDRDTTPQVEKLCCKKHGVTSYARIQEHGHPPGHKVCALCLVELFPEVGGAATRDTTPQQVVECSMEQCPSFTDIGNKCCFCGQPFCDAHGNRQRNTCDRCAQEAMEEIGRHSH